MGVLMVLIAWFLVSVPASIVVGWMLRSEADPELVGMEGSDAVFAEADGRLTRVSLLDPVAH